LMSVTEVALTMKAIGERFSITLTQQFILA
jgi:hypothetical protein